MSHLSKHYSLIVPEDEDERTKYYPHTDQHYHRRSVPYQGFEMTYQAVPAESVTTEHCQEGPGRHWTMADECQALQEQGRTLYDDC